MYKLTLGGLHRGIAWYDFPGGGLHKLPILPSGIIVDELLPSMRIFDCDFDFDFI